MNSNEPNEPTNEPANEPADEPMSAAASPETTVSVEHTFAVPHASRVALQKMRVVHA